jgi:hypothetical protein
LSETVNPTLYVVCAVQFNGLLEEVAKKEKRNNEAKKNEEKLKIFAAL